MQKPPRFSREDFVTANPLVEADHLQFALRLVTKLDSAALLVCGAMMGASMVLLYQIVEQVCR